jgi:hypothetical protein
MSAWLAAAQPATNPAVKRRDEPEDDDELFDDDDDLDIQVRVRRHRTNALTSPSR